MSLAQQLAAGLIMIGLVTTLILKDRQTEAILRTGGNVLNNAFRQVMGQAK